ncbi:MAG: methyltransferase domain-containing protein [Acidobacteriota bacterium]|nr:methyltransferase domain-containing protein [Acidobacteriota bacterium]
MKSREPSRLLGAVLFAFLPVAAAAQPRQPPGEPGRHHHQGGAEGEHGLRHDGGIEHSFDDAEAWAARFEGAERDVWQLPDEVVAALELTPGMTVADVGSGTGYFARRFARAVGSEGTVFAADVEPEMGAYVRKRADEEGQANLIPVLASYDDPRLPDGAVDLVFVCNTWHHIRDRVDYARRLAGDLAPGGRVAIVDFVKEPLPVGPDVEHKLTAEEVIGEFVAAGYRLAGSDDLLPYQYLLIFEPAGDGLAFGSPAPYPGPRRLESSRRRPSRPGSAPTTPRVDPLPQVGHQE